MDLSERLKQLRKEKGLTQVELAKELNVSSGTVAMWETGKRKPQFDMIEKLCDYFNRRMDYILGASDTPQTAALTEEDIDQTSIWSVEEQYEDMLRKYALLDDYGKASVDAVIRTEFNRAQEQGTLCSGQIISVSVRSKQRFEG